MKHVPVFVAAALAFAVAGCGGSDSGSGTKTDPTAVLTRIEAVNHMDDTIVQDPQNFQIGEEYTFELVSYNSAGVRTVLPNVTWAMSDSTSQYGTLGGNSGLFVAADQETPTEQTMQARTSAGDLYKATYRIKPRQARLLGQVVSEKDHAKGIDGVTIDFYTLSPVDASNPNGVRTESYAGTVVTSYDGKFRASVPQSVARYQIRSESIPSTYFRSYQAPLQSGTYSRFDSGTDGSCHPPVPSGMPEVGQIGMSALILVTPKSGVKPNASDCYYSN